MSDKNFIIARFDSSGVETISGAEITFNTTPSQNGQFHHLVSSTFEEPLTATFQICKNLCDTSDSEISLDEFRDMSRWLNRSTFHKLRFIDVNGEYSNIWYEASFNLSKIEIGGKIVGIELNCQTNRPFAFREPTTINIKNLQPNELYSIYSQSDQEGCLYFDELQITIESDGDFEMYNSMEPDRVTKIANCKTNEVITINYPLIDSSLGNARGTKLQNDFNWCFPRIATQFKNKLNNICVNGVSCSMVIKYTPIVKVCI